MKISKIHKISITHASSKRKKKNDRESKNKESIARWRKRLQSCEDKLSSMRSKPSLSRWRLKDKQRSKRYRSSKCHNSVKKRSNYSGPLK